MHPLLTYAHRHAPLLTAAGLLAAWELACRLFAIPAYVFPAPSEIVRAAGTFTAPQLFGHFRSTVEVVIAGFVAAIAVSFPVAVMITHSPLLSRTLVPILVVIHSTPIVAVAPIIVVALGAGVLPRVVITCLITFFPLVISLVTGLRATPAEILELSRSLRASRNRELWFIRMPFAVPYIFSALKVCITLAVIGAVVGEFVTAESGLGYLILFSTSMMKMPQSFVALAILVVLSLLLYQAIERIERRWFAWSLPRRDPA
ncbi:ABC transporter permease [Pigmentiphaga sp. GD03639]|jgi:NitT/TauT family transport system permease protein|uniref:ABC transporter permease n=1 Tax=unclassified Pigmentiphaga TaxID=2626614 RepID=UPI0010503E9D|nr:MULTISPECIES: ABC transporter permease [unclassified Pigmentiphaga]MDH2236484.1 ABC transporter permease [Pigmentiphaga sp. GD03639]